MMRALLLLILILFAVPAAAQSRVNAIQPELVAEGPAGVTLTDNFAMLPTSAVSGFYFGHRDSQYFGVARIGRDQLENYAARREVSIEQAERWLRPNLD